MILVNNRDKIEWRDGVTIQDILDEMNYTYTMITIHIDDVFVEDHDYDTTIVKDGANVSIFHLAHGG